MKHLLAVMLLGLSAVPALASDPSAAAVTIKDDAYSPASLTVNVGQIVTFTNRDDDAHTVTSTTGAFDSQGLDTNGVWRYRFVKAGVYEYFCELHPFMKGTIVVKAAGS